jgi:hypothetical protein
MTYPLKKIIIIISTRKDLKENLWIRKLCELLAFCHQIQIVCKCAQKCIMENEIVRFGGLNYFFLIILREPRVNRLREFGRFVRILEDQCKWETWIIISMFSRIGLSEFIGPDFFSKRNYLPLCHSKEPFFYRRTNVKFMCYYSEPIGTLGFNSSSWT